MSAIRSTFLIFIWSLPILVCIGLLSLLNYNEFIGFWFLSPYNYPLSFTIALFISLTLSVIGIWILRQQSQDFNLIIVISCIFLGCLLRLSVYSAEVTLTFIFTLIILLCVYRIFEGIIPGDKNLINLIYASISLSLGGIAFYIIPLILVFIACKFPIPKPSSQAKRFRYASPVLGAILLFSYYTFGTSFYVTPGLIIPHNIRHIWGDIQNPRYQEQASAKVKSCPLITDTIGEAESGRINKVGVPPTLAQLFKTIEATAPAEKLNFPSMVDNDSLVNLSLEVVGKRGTAIIKDCTTDVCCPKNLYADTTKFNQNISGKQIYYAQSLH